ncbi:MAG TPA: GNAT family N-acetyltransferase [Caulobacteraceae bacterium]
MVKVQVAHPSELTPTDLDAWSRLQADAPEFGSPLLGPGFARAVGDIRRDARVAIWREGGQAIGFLGFHRTLGGFARPIGAPFSDYQALVSAPGFPAPAEALKAAGVQGVRLTGLVDPHRVFPEPLETVLAHQIDLSAGAEAYFAELWAGSRNRWRNYKRYSRRLERQIGPLRVAAPDCSAAMFDTLLAWKQRQLAATGLHDFTTSPWVREMLERLFQTREESFGGLMISLYAGDRPVAAHFGVRQGNWFHPWIGAYDPELAGFSPGVVHQLMAAEAAAGLGVQTYDLGPRADRSKTMFANRAVPVRVGLAASGSLTAQLAAGSERLLDRPLAGFGLLGRMRNRWDHIAAVEQTAGGRIAGVWRAAAALNRRVDAWSRAA